MPNNALLTVMQVAIRLGKSPSTIRRLSDSGELPPAQKLPGPNGAILFREADVSAYERANAEQATA